MDAGWTDLFPKLSSVVTNFHPASCRYVLKIPTLAALNPQQIAKNTDPRYPPKNAGD
jgi:hypothetical protein